MLRFLLEGSGSLIQERQNINNLAPLLIAILVVVVFASVAVLIQVIKKWHLRPEWIEAQKKKPSTLETLNKTAEKYNLNADEKSLLWEACKLSSAPNIFYLSKDIVEIDKILSKLFKTISEGSKKKSDNLVTSIFTLRNKIELANKITVLINNTYKLKNGQFINLFKNEDQSIRLKITSVEKDGFYLELPSNLQSVESRPKELAKVRFSFIHEDNNFYYFDTRIIRYTKLHDIPQMLVAHSPVNYQERRKYRRISFNKKLDCNFCAVKLKTSIINSKTVLEYLPQEKQYPANILNICAGGCKILTKLPIKEEQYIHLNFVIGNKTCSATGIILRTIKDKVEELYSLRIRFVQLSAEDKNCIMASVYGYN